MNKNIFKKFIIFTVAPFCIPIIGEIIPDSHIIPEFKHLLLVLAFMIDILYAWNFYKSVSADRLKNFSDIINKESYSNARELCERKRDYIINKTYDAKYKIDDNDVPYDIHNYIAEICKNFCNTISEITSMDKKYMGVTFIYRYKYADADYSMWKWIVGKEGTTTISLDQFVKEPDTLYFYLINGDKNGDVDSIFCNDKRKLEKIRHYHMSKRDDAHDNEGSVFASKILFGNNATHFVEGILIVSTYGKRFITNNNCEYSESELKNLIFEELFPYYQRLLEAELGMLYLRHIKD